MKKSILCMVTFLMITALWGCGKKDVVYDEGKNTQTQEKANGGSLLDTLGVGEEKMWKEDVQGVEVSATYHIPDTTNLYTMEAEKYYVTKEDKKRIAEYFMDPDTIKVDKDLLPTRESIQQEIDSNKEYIKESPDLDEDTLALYDSEEALLTQQLETVKDPEEISEDAGDYSEDFYIGSKDGTEYSLIFFADKDRNRSRWQIYADTQDMDYGADGSPVETENKCSMSREEAEQRAVKICQELGMPEMTPFCVYPLLWTTYDEEAENGIGTEERNGYVIELSRSIEGVPADIMRYFEWNATTSVLHYSIEQVEVALTDDRVIDVFYDGMMTEGTAEGPVKILNMEQIKDVFRQEIAKNPENEDIQWRDLSLKYVRMNNPDNPDGFRYIPVWCLSQEYQEDTIKSTIWTSTSPYIMINAMDGSRIDLEKEGTVLYENSQGLQW